MAAGRLAAAMAAGCIVVLKSANVACLSALVFIEDKRTSFCPT